MFGVMLAISARLFAVFGNLLSVRTDQIVAPWHIHSHIPVFPQPQGGNHCMGGTEIVFCEK